MTEGEAQARSVFEPDGPLAAAFGGYEYRDGQVEMAALVQKAYEEGGIALVEAGTGIGKSFAYLVPALLNAGKGEAGGRTVIATATKNLETQLWEKDIPQLFQALGRSCRAAVLYGRSNYICLRRLEEKLLDMRLFEEDPRSLLSKFKEFCAGTDTGLFQDCRTPIPPGIREYCASDGDLCRGKRCPFLPECFYQKAKVRAMQADIVVTNHHLLFTDANYRLEEAVDQSQNAILPAYSRLVVDEAHLAEQNATDLFTATYSSAEALRQLRALLRTGAGEAEGPLDSLAPRCPSKELPELIRREAAQMRSLIQALDLALQAFLASRRTKSLLCDRSMETEIQAALGPQASNVLEGRERLAGLLARFQAAVKDNAEDALVGEFSRLAARLDRAFEPLEEFMGFSSWTDDAHYIQTRSARGKDSWEVCVAPVSVGGKLSDGLFSKLRTVVCCSATLNLGDDFRFFRSRVGLEGRDVLTLVAPSPFDYERSLMLLAPSDAPQFSPKDEGPFTDAAASIILDAVSSSQGGALVLFTSYKMMEGVRKRISGGLSRLGIDTLMQGQGSRKSLLERFKTDKDSVLLATNSFWQGVDVPGESLRLVVIVKLPFAAPDEPVHKARLEHLEKEGKSGFACLQLPSATMRLKQGFGRLIRNKTDRGVVLVIDSRLVAKPYGRQMLDSLPACYRPETTVGSIAARIESFLYS